MIEIFRVVRNSDGEEIQRSVALIAACMQWVKDPDGLRVERIPAGSTAGRDEVSASECCKVLREWLRHHKNKNLVSQDDWKDMAALIKKVCGWFCG